jgi:hypothetical protein
MVAEEHDQQRLALVIVAADGLAVDRREREIGGSSIVDGVRTMCCSLGLSFERSGREWMSDAAVARIAIVAT